MSRLVAALLVLAALVAAPAGAPLRVKASPAVAPCVGRGGARVRENERTDGGGGDGRHRQPGVGGGRRRGRRRRLAS